jgi:hypothetical protein
VGDVSSSERGLEWSQVTAVSVPHNSTGWFVGPEDPRIDTVNGARFVLANVNVDVAGCPAVEHEFQKPRQMFFAPVDTIADARPCLIQLEGVSPCRVQKNWSPLVAKGSASIYFVYSLSPFKMLKFNKKACAASFTSQAVESKFDETGSRLGHVHGGTRFVHGISTLDGDVYFAVAHTAPPDYSQILTAVLMKHGPNDDPSFHLIGMSCPLKFIDMSGRHGRDEPKTITTSIVDYDPASDLARITFQAYDSENYHSEVQGVRSWLETTYDEFKNGGPVVCTP